MDYASDLTNLPYYRFCVKHLKYPDGPNYGKPFIPLQWQLELARDMFARDSEGDRLTTHVYVSAARGAGKTTFMASILLYLLCSRHEEVSPELLTSATQRDQARIAFDKVASMVASSPTLRTRVKVNSTRISYKLGYIKAVSKEARSALGLTPSCIIFDESAFLTDRRHYDSLVSGAFKRPNSLVIHITTSGNDESSWGYELDRTYREVHEGKVASPKVVTRFFEADRDCDPMDETQWYKANPSLGHTVRVEDVRHQAMTALQSPAALNRFKTFQLNQWTSPDETYLTLDEWLACVQPIPDLTGRRCYGGLDLSSSRDMTSFVMLFPPDKEGEPYYVIPYFWLPDDTLAERDKHTMQPYLQWKNDGLLLTTPGNIIDLAFIQQTIEDAAETYQILDIGYDPWASAQLVPALHEQGIPLTPVRQGARTLGAPMKELDKMVGAEQLASNHPILTWQMSNLQARYDANGNPTPNRKNINMKIDGAAALINAIERMMYNQAQPGLVDLTPDQVLLW